MLTLKRRNDCFLAILLLHQAGAFVGGRIKAPLTTSSPFQEATFLDTPSHLSSPTSSAPWVTAHRRRSILLTRVALDPLTESSSSSQNENEKGASVKPNVDQSLRSNRSVGQKKKPLRFNPAFGDTQFLRKRTDDLLRTTSMDNLDDDGNIIVPSLGLKVKTKTFHFLIDAWAFSGEVDAADQALTLLDRMEELEDINCLSNVRPNVRSYTKAINAVARSMRPDAGEIADGVLEKMENLSSSGANPLAKPNAFTYTAVIEAHANSGASGAAEKSEEVLDTMIRKFENGDEDVTPTSRSFNAVINAYGKSGYHGAASQAKHLFDRMINLYTSGVEGCKPNTFDYNSLIMALANSAEEGSAQLAAEVLRRMEKRFQTDKMDCRPTTVTYNAVINAFAKSGNEDAAQRAEEILLKMEKLYEAGEDVQPNTRSFNSVMNAWAKSTQEDAADHAQELFDFMNGLYKKTNKSVRPDVHSFCTVINAWGRSQKAGKAEHANDIFESMVKQYKNGNKNLKPNIVIINAVINACAYTYGDWDEHQRAMEIAHNHLKLLETSDYGIADHLTYGSFLKVCANQMEESDARRQIAEVIVKKCIRDGQFGNLVLQQLQRMGPPETYQALVGHSMEEDIRLEDLPSSWHSNVVEGKWARRRNH
ncbi:MAG: hypothetical protein SGBAC_007244 [Bacillariaceae sp.]